MSNLDLLDCVEGDCGDQCDRSPWTAEARPQVQDAGI